MLIKLNSVFKMENVSQCKIQYDENKTWQNQAREMNLIIWFKTGIYIVDFDQQMNAWACVHMVENDKKPLKMMKKVPFSSCAQEAHEKTHEFSS